MINPMQLLQIRGMWTEFTSRHPKFPHFLNAVAQNGITEGTIIEIQITTAEGKNFASNLKISKEDMELFQKMKAMK